MQGVLSTLLGFFLLGGVEFHVMNVLGITINAIGGTWCNAVPALLTETAMLCFSYKASPRMAGRKEVAVLTAAHSVCNNIFHSCPERSIFL
jgi:hypothetical protein